MLTTSTELADLGAALAKAQGQIRVAVEDSVNPHFRSRYASLAAVWKACRGPLAANGLSVVQGIGTAGGEVVCTTRLIHASGQWVESVLTVAPRKADAQGIGSAATYARRYTLSALVGIATAENDDDGNEASETRQATDNRPPPNEAPEAPATAHHASWPGDRARFCATVGDLGWTYEDLCTFLSWRGGKSRPSSWAQSTRNRLLTKFQSPDEELAESITEWSTRNADG